MADHVGMMDVRWTGREGEKIFSLLCSRRKVTCNKAEEDNRGWDYILHFPAPAIITIPTDQRDGWRSCRFRFHQHEAERQTGLAAALFHHPGAEKIGGLCRDAVPIRTTLEAINAQFVPLSVLDALVAHRTLGIEVTPAQEREGDVRTFLSYASVQFGEVAMGGVASCPVISDIMIGARRRIDFGPATILHATVNGGGIGLLRERYLDELDRLSEAANVLAIGDLQRGWLRPPSERSRSTAPSHPSASAHGFG